MYTQKYCLVHFISPVSIGDEFNMKDWPLHITLADVFAIDRSTTDIDTKLKNSISSESSVDVKATRESILGQTRVVLITKVAGIIELHESIVDLLESNEAIFNSPEFTRKGFLPHSTIQMDERLYEGDKVSINSISLVDMFPDSDWQQRRVLATFTLQEE